MNLSENWFYTHPTLPTPISVTHEVLKSGRQQSKSNKKLARKQQVNFNVYNSKKFDNKDENLEKLFKTSSYSRDFYVPYASVCPPKSSIVDDIDPLFNRKPVNVFQMLPWAPGKFMDDHFSRPTAERKRINFFRQMRQISYLDKTYE
ncbi:uncharacterized protein LOC119612221 [Lucilia sericata]|uniref:uncharacterized protein LOC119612221 n=1 Tax=Lucilia sericata TaxID=13632 RepID=UPI0018A825D0|nr:uncharacterized protein LOC119612221 [Lucilia sericata]